MNIADEVYSLIKNRISDHVYPTKVRNQLITYGMEHSPMWEGEMYTIKSRNLGGGIWQVWAEVRTF